jgi:hypothetical protein
MRTSVELGQGVRVRITQQVPRQSGAMSTSVEGEILRVGQQKTGSWYAHSKDKKLWIDRVELKKDDGEIAYVNLDQHSHVEILSD